MITTQPFGRTEHASSRLIFGSYALYRAGHWLFGHPDIFIATAGDMQLLPRVLEAAGRLRARPSDDDMAALAAKYDVRPVFK